MDTSESSHKRSAESIDWVENKKQKADPFSPSPMGLRLPDLPPYILSRITSFLDNESALNLASRDQEKATNADVESLRRAVVEGQGFEGLVDPELIHGLLRTANRYSSAMNDTDRSSVNNASPIVSPNPTLRQLSAAVPVSPEVRKQAYSEASPYRTALQSVVWRNYASPQRLPKTPENATTLRDLGRRIDQTYQINQVLSPDPKSKEYGQLYPSKGYYGRDKSETTQNVLRDYSEHILETNALPEMQHLLGGKGSTPLDDEASKLAKAAKIGGSGQNFGFTTSKEGRRRSYSNNPIDPKALPVESGEYGNPELQRAEHWGKEQGIDRIKEKYTIPFHSEMQALEDIKPWQVKESGNQFLACPQCFTGYHAYGLGNQAYSGGTHGIKVASVIPSGIRKNAAFLEKYVGPNAWQTLLDSPPEQVGSALDTLERDTNRGASDIVHPLLGVKGRDYNKLFQPEESSASLKKLKAVEPTKEAHDFDVPVDEGWLAAVDEFERGTAVKPVEEDFDLGIDDESLLKMMDEHDKGGKK